MRRSSSRSVQSSGSASTICWKSAARPIGSQGIRARRGRGRRGGEARGYARIMAVADKLQEEYRALLEGCGLLDRSERGKLALTGADALAFLNGQVTNELMDLAPGEGRYAAFLTHKGKM